MITDNWFHSWHPPSLLPDQRTVHSPLSSSVNFSGAFENGYPLSQRNTFSRPDTFLPYLLSLSIFSPNAKKSSLNNLFDSEPLERSGPFKTVYYWNELDFDYPSGEDREAAIIYNDFIPKHNLPLGLEVFGNRIFVTMPKWKPGVPVTLAVIPRVSRESSPKLVPYPNWSWHTSDTCEGLVSVFRIQADSCNRLWVLDSGLIHVTESPKQVCPPKLLIFNLKSDELITKYIFPEEFIKQDSLYSNLMVDIRGHDCENVHAYLTDVWRFGLVVFSLKRMRGWRISDHTFFPEPLAAHYKLHHLEFDWTDGLFGMALSPFETYDMDRTLYYHSMSGFREFKVKTSIICNETGWENYKNAFEVMGQSRGKSGHVSSSWMDRRGIMFFNMVTRDTIGCWDSQKPYKRANLGVVARNSETLVFPNDIKVDQEQRQSVWVITNKLPFYLYEGLDKNEINFRILSAYADEATKGTICDPNISDFNSFIEFMGDDDCY